MTNEHAAIDALGDPVRGAILELLAQGPRAVGELARELPVTRPAVSQHLKVLKDAGLVRSRRAGTRNVYRADPEAIARVRGYFDRLWTDALAAYQEFAETEEETT